MQKDKYVSLFIQKYLGSEQIAICIEGKLKGSKMFHYTNDYLNYIKPNSKKPRRIKFNEFIEDRDNLWQAYNWKDIINEYNEQWTDEDKLESIKEYLNS